MTRIRLLHTGDLHYGHSRFLPQDAHIERHRQMGQEILQICKSQSVDQVIIAGDLAHRIDLSPAEELAMMEFLHELDKVLGDSQDRLVDSCWMATSGNHDYMGIGRSRLDFLNHARFQKAYLATNEPKCIMRGGLCHILIPFGGYSTNDLELIVEHFTKTVWTPWSNDIGEQWPIVVTCHEHFHGAVYDTGYVGKGKYPKVPDIPEVAYWALGDIHLYQALRANAVYCGAPMQHTFGEALPKGVLLVDFENGNLKQEFVPLQTPGQLITLEQPPEEWDTRHFYRLVGNAQVVQSNSDQLIYTEFNNDIQIDLNPDKILTQVEDVLLDVGLPRELLPEALEVHEDTFKKCQGAETWV